MDTHTRLELTTEEALKRRDFLLEAMDFEVKSLMRCLEEYPEDKLSYKPHEKSMGGGELFWHIAGGSMFMVNGACKGEFATGGKGPEAPESKSALKGALEKMFADTRAMAAAASGEAMAKQVDFMGMGELPAVEYLDWSLQHLIHHRGQMTVYLRLLGAKVPSIYGGSADEQMSAE